MNKQNKLAMYKVFVHCLDFQRTRYPKSVTNYPKIANKREKKIKIKQ